MWTGRLKGKTPELSSPQRAVLLRLHATGELFSVSRATVDREIARTCANKPMADVR